MKIMTEHIPEQVIPAHDCVTEIYKFDELPSGTQDRLVRRCAEIHANDWEHEYRDTLKKLEELFGVKCKDWSVDGWSHDYYLYVDYSTYFHFSLEDAAECNREEDNESEYWYLSLKGNRAMGKCWTKWEREVVRGNWHYVGKHSRYSRVVFSGLHDGSCPLTGFCADNDALDPLWDMMEGKHIKDGMTIAEMIDACFESFFTSWEKDIRYHQSEEYFRENEMAEWYDADGNEVDVPEDAVLTDPPTEAVA
jgi:hypothetical protein